ncbi:MAG: hypothetical protein IPJ88_16940 [Myxococcales bacterium]|nr:MAG: hypothetical protein IPJ88_16940 [Myxococcales bacterium]
MAGAPGWHQYAGGSPSSVERALLAQVSGFDLARNAHNTDFRFYHGRTDTGPMRPHYVEEFEALLQRKNIPYKNRWYDAGHDILYIVERREKLFEDLTRVVRNPHPAQIKMVTSDFRANRQHWLEVTRFDGYPALAEIDGKIEDSTLSIKSKGASALRIYAQDLPLSPNRELKLQINGEAVFEGKRDALGHRVNVVHQNGKWRLAYPETSTLEKKPGLSGPLTDGYYEPAVHVYGSQNESTRSLLEQSATKAARGWPLWLWFFSQPVVADSELSEAQIKNNNIVLYGTPDDNIVLKDRFQATDPDHT